MISQKIQWGMTFVVQLFDSGSLNLNLWPLHFYVYLLEILPANTEKDKKKPQCGKIIAITVQPACLLFHLEKKVCRQQNYLEEKK